MAKKQHDHGFEMMAIVGIVAVVGLIIMFMNTGNLSGEAYGEKKMIRAQFESSVDCTTVDCTPGSTHFCCANQVSELCDGTSTLTCGSGAGSFPAYCSVVNDVAVYGCTE